MNDYKILRMPAVIQQTDYARSTIYLRVAQELLTKPIALGARAVGWPEHEIAALNHARIAGIGDQSIRQLVQTLESQRQSGQQEVRNG